MKDDSDPLNGWLNSEVMQYAPPAKKDVYGSLFFYIQDLLLKFCRRVQGFAIHIELYQVNAVKLPSLLEGRSSSFDRIEVSKSDKHIHTYHHESMMSACIVTV
jgi:hypothetical protein